MLPGKRMRTAYLGLGSNINAEKNLQFAVQELRRRFAVIKLSAVYRSAAVGFEGPDFLNLVAEIETALPPESVNRQISEIQALAGREQDDERYASRTLDIDLLLVDQLSSDRLRIPRPDVLAYGFVLKPLADIAPDFVHPETGCTLGEHWRKFADGSHPLTITDVIL